MTIEIPTFFRHCPRCGQPAPALEPGNVFHCLKCDFLLYFNPAIAVATIVSNPHGEVLLIQRAKDPGKGLAAFPGGFVDAGERAEEAARREVWEEVNVKVDSVSYLCSLPNRYLYHGIPYTVLDLFFTAKAQETQTVIETSEVASVSWVGPSQVRKENLAFPSHGEAWNVFMQTMARPAP